MKVFLTNCVLLLLKIFPVRFCQINICLSGCLAAATIFAAHTNLRIVLDRRTPQMVPTRVYEVPVIRVTENSTMAYGTFECVFPTSEHHSEEMSSNGILSCFRS